MGLSGFCRCHKCAFDARFEILETSYQIFYVGDAYTSNQESQYTVGHDGNINRWVQIGALTQGFEAIIEQCQADRLDEVARLRSRAFGDHSLSLIAQSYRCMIAK